MTGSGGSVQTGSMTLQEAITIVNNMPGNGPRENMALGKVLDAARREAYRTDAQ